MIKLWQEKKIELSLDPAFKKAQIILGDNITVSQTKGEFLSHLSQFEPVLNDLLKRSLEKKAKTHLNFWIGTEKSFLNGKNDKPVIEKDFLTVWEENTSKFKSVFKETSSSEKCFNDFFEMREKLTGTARPELVRTYFAENASSIAESFKISKSLFWDIEKHDFYSETVSRFSMMLSDLTTVDLNSLLMLTSYDEQGSLFLCHKLIYGALKCVLASQIIIGLYKPGAFFTFLEKAVLIAKSIGNTSFAKKAIWTISSSTRWCYVGVSGVTLGITLYTGAFSKSKLDIVSYIPPLYYGYSGKKGEFISYFRLCGSTFFYEVSKTISTLTSAALVGFLEPKQELIRKLLEEASKKK